MFEKFFHAASAGAAGRGVRQFVTVGAGQPDAPSSPGAPAGSGDARAWDIDASAPGQAAGALRSAGFQPDSPALFSWDATPSGGMADSAVTAMLSELRSLATPGTRLALVLPHPQRDRCEQIAQSSRWRLGKVSERAHNVGCRILLPVWQPPGPGMAPSHSGIAAFAERMLYRPPADVVAGHLAAEYDVNVSGLREVDLGVYQVNLAHGDSWIARVFPSSRDTASVSVDAGLLQWLSAAGFPAERCAPGNPVSAVDGFPVLVTQRAAGRAMTANPQSFALLGRLLGQLHAMPAGDQPAAQRPGGAWHHLLPAGSPADELDAARTLLHDARHRVGAAQSSMYEALAEAVEAADPCDDLPQALVHPDCVPRNALGEPDDGVTIIDWAGAGRGPRIVSLGCLLWSAARSMPCLDAAISSYQELITLEPGEASRLGAAMRLRPLILSCWTFATGRCGLPDSVADWDKQCAVIDKAAGHARAALAR